MSICDWILTKFKDSITNLFLFSNINLINKEFLKPNALKRLEELNIDNFNPNNESLIS